MTAHLSAADIAAINAMSIEGSRDSGINVGQVCGVVGGVLGGLAAVSRGGSVGGAIAGAAAGAAVGYAAGTVFGPAEWFGTAGKILSGAAAGLVGVGVSSNVAALVDCFVNPDVVI